MTKVKDLLRESQENAQMTQNNTDLDMMFNMKIEGLDKSEQLFSNTDERSKYYLKKLDKVRQQQKVLLPLFM